MADDGSHPLAPPAAIAWVLITLGTALGAATAVLGPLAAAGIALGSEIGLALILYGILCGPLILIGLMFARLDGFSAAGLGTAPAKWAPAGLLLGGAGLAIAAGYSALEGSVVRGQGSHAGTVAFVVGVVLTLFQTAGEEIFFRGWLMRAIERRAGAMTGIALSALAFSGFHLLGGADSILSAANLFLAGIWYGLLAWRSGGLAAPVLAHFGWNAGAELIAGLSPNPGTGSFGALMDWDLVGSPLWGGTEDGLDASLGMTFVLAAMIVPLIWRFASVAAGPARHRSGPAAE